MNQRKTTPATLSAALAAAALLAAGPAFAQGSAQTRPPSTMQSQPGTSTAPSASHQMQGTAQSPAAARAALQQQLQQAGFRSVHILATGYVMQATSPSGELVTVSASPQSSPQANGTTGQSHAATQSKLRQALEQAGFKNVEVVDRGYVAQAQAPDGNTVVMALNLPAGGAVSGSSMPPAGGTGSSSTNGGSTK